MLSSMGMVLSQLSLSFLLEVLSFIDMREWQERFLFEGESEGGVFSALRELSIINCPKLSKDLPNQLSSLITPEIRHCQ